MESKQDLNEIHTFGDVENAPQPEEQTTIKKGSTFKLNKTPVIVHQIDLPRLTLDTTDKSTWNPALRSEVIQVEEYHFLVKATAGKRLYLINVQVDATQEG